MTDSIFNADNASSFRDFFVMSTQAETEILCRVVRAFDDESLSYKPHDKSMTAAENAWHCGGSVAWFRQGIETGTFPMEEAKIELPNTAAELADLIEKTSNEQLNYFRALSTDELLKKIPFFDNQSYYALDYINWGMLHLVHHRGQLSTYLRASGGKVPSIYGPSADESMEMMAEGGAA